MRVASILPNFSSQNYEHKPARLNQNQINRDVSFCGGKYDILIQKILTIFTTKGFDLPKNLSEPIYGRDKVLMSIKKGLSNGNELVVSKKGLDREWGTMQYLLFKENGSNPYKDSIAVDIRLGHILLFDKSNQKPIFERNRFKELPLENPKHAELEAKLEEWLKEIFPDTSSANKASTETSGKLEKPYTPHEVLGFVPPPNGGKIPVRTRIVPTNQNGGIPGGKGIKDMPNPQHQNSVPTGKKPVPLAIEKRVSSEPQPGRSTSIPNPTSRTGSPAEERPVPNANGNPATTEVSHKKRGRPVGYKVPKNNDIGVLAESLQEELREINTFMADIIRIRRQNSGHIWQWNADFNSKYPVIDIAKQSRQNSSIVFKYNENERIGVKIPKGNRQIVQLIHYSSDGNETTFFINENSKLISNVQKYGNNFRFPKDSSMKYVAAKELEESPVKKYISFVREELEKYYNAYIESYNKNIQSGTRKRRSVKGSDKSINNTPNGTDSTQLSKDPKSHMPGNSEPASQIEINPNFEQLLATARKQADIDAGKLAQAYLSALTEKLPKKISEGLGNLKERLQTTLTEGLDALEKFIADAFNLKQ